ncbi:MAG: lytic transglycosylase domain-containing protein [Mycobacteriales bacterium]
MSRNPVAQPAVVLVAALLVLAGGVAAAVVGRPSLPATTRPVAVAPVAVPVLEHADRSRVVPVVAPLRKLLTPDLLVTSSRPLSAAQIAALRRIRGLIAGTMLLRGTTHVSGTAFRTVAVDPSAFRGFTPRETARSDALWAAVARGELAPSFASRLPLGATVLVTGRIRTTARIGAMAAYGIPGADVVVGTDLGRQLGLQPTSFLLAAPERGVHGLTRDVRRVLGDGARVDVLRPAAIVHRRPRTYRELYQYSARYCPGLSWTVLAAIGQIESGHGRNVGPSSAGALGPMQFLPSTWAFAGVDGDGDGKADIMNPFDAVPAAALYLCRDGAGRGGQDLYNAIFSYNHADWYVREVLDLAARYR